jgi:hypothetical protein
VEREIRINDPNGRRKYYKTSAKPSGPAESSTGSN